MRVVGFIGKVLIVGGIVLLLFTAYQVFGTSFQEAHTQAQLRSQLEKESSNAEIKRALAEADALDKLPTGPPVVAPHRNAPAEGKPVGVIRIPKIGINQVVVEGTATQDLRKGPGHYIGTPLPGEAGNSGIAGHRTTYGHPFYNLNEMKKGNVIVVTTVQGIFVYKTLRTEVVSPSDGKVLKNAFGAYLTLTTCNPRFSASTRLVVFAKLAHSQLFPNSGLGNGPPQKLRSGDLAGNSSGAVLDAVLWGAVTLAVGIGVLLVARRYRQQRWIIWVVGSAGILVLLYFFFNAISPLLPASF